MGVGTLIRYLVGDREAILGLAASRRTIFAGFLFVLSAGFAREYDGEDLLHEPWHALAPVGASLAASFALFVVAYRGFVRRSKEESEANPHPPFFSAYASFLGLFWMTAPLAWFYAIPYERFLSPAQAMGANLCTLGLVSVWRVALMVRVLVVLMGYRPLAAAALVLAFADVVVLSAMFFVPVPLIDLMGGLRLSESREVLRSVAVTVCFWGTCSLPVLLVGAIVALRRGRPTWWHLTADAASLVRAPRALAMASVAIWAIPLAFTQPEQILRHRVERDFTEGHVGRALAVMSSHSATDFPPFWSPPPESDPWRSDGESCVLGIWEVFADLPPPPWVREVYLRKLRDLLQAGRVQNAERLAALLGRIAEGPELLRELDPDTRARFQRALGDSKAGPDAGK